MPIDVAQPVGAYAKKENVAAGVAWMLLTGLLFVGVTGIVRHLGSDLPAAEGAFIRYAIGLVMISPALIGAFRRRIPGKVWALYAGRGMVHGFGVML